MKILIASSEVFPFSKTGGLADMVGALGKALGRSGHEVAIVTPLYAGLRERFTAIEKFDWHMHLPLGSEWQSANVWTLNPWQNVRVYFVDQPAFYGRAQLYTEAGVDYPDNPRRFVFFSKAVVHLARHLSFKPDILHVHDWQTGLVPLLALHQKFTDGWMDAPKTCLTIHNLAYQGVFHPSAYSLTNLPPDYFNPNGVEFHGFFNFLKAGLVYSDRITTVSPRYAREITTEEFGAGLDGILRQRLTVLHGILNGVDYDEWVTVKNPHLKHSFSVTDLSGKAAEKADLQRELGLPVDDKVPLFASITRLADQKGIDIMLGALEEMLAANIQFALLGSGSPQFEKAFTNLAARYPNKASVTIGYNHGLSHRIEAGSDFFLMPSRYEPCGLNQMYSLRYGTIPIVRVTGGLDDSVVDISEKHERANGIKFHEYSVRALAKAIRKAVVLFDHPGLLQHYRMNGMRADFSWERTANEYVNAYSS